MAAFAEQKAQIGVEAVTGTPVPATRRLTSPLTITDKRETGKVTPSGEYFTSLVYQKYENTEGKIEGTPCFRELRSILDLAFGAPATTELEDGVAYSHEFALSTNRPTWTVEFGDSSHAAQATSVFASGINFEWSANSGDSSFSVDLVGGKLTDGHTLTADTEAIEPIPVIAENVKVYVDSSADAIGTTQLTEMLGVKLAFADVASQVRYLGAPTGRVNTRPSATVELVAEATTRVRELRSTRQVRYIRIEATDVLLPGATVPASLRIDLAAQVSEHSRGDSDNVYAATLGLEIIKDASGFAPKLTLVTDQP